MKNVLLCLILFASSASYAESYNCNIIEGVKVGEDGKFEPLSLGLINEERSFVVDTITGRILSGDYYTNNDRALDVRIVSKGIDDNSLDIVSISSGPYADMERVNQLSIRVWVAKTNIPFSYQIWGGWMLSGLCNPM